MVIKCKLQLGVSIIFSRYSKHFGVPHKYIKSTTLRTTVKYSSYWTTIKFSFQNESFDEYWFFCESLYACVFFLAVIEIKNINKKFYSNFQNLQNILCRTKFTPSYKRASCLEQRPYKINGYIWNCLNVEPIY